MPLITKIIPQKRRENRRNIFLDGAFAFGLSDNVVARFRLREGMTLTNEEVERLAEGEVRQACLDDGLKYLGMRLHSQAELRRKLMKREYGGQVVEGVLADLVRMGYVDDARYARAKAMSAAEHKHHGRRRAFAELMKAGVNADVAEKALDEVYSAEGVGADQLSTARELARKKLASLKKLDPLAAKRRLVGMLQRRGFDYETIRPIVDEMLGTRDEEGPAE